MILILSAPPFDGGRWSITKTKRRKFDEALGDLMADKDSLPMLITLLCEGEATRGRLLADAKTPDHGAILIDSLMQLGIIEAYRGPEPSSCSYKLSEKGRELMGRLRPAPTDSS
jgi:hypothetical protein